MATTEILAKLKPGQTLLQTVEALNGLVIDGQKIKVVVESQCVPYLKHVLSGSSDGPAVSKVEAHISGQQPGEHKWRRFTLSREGLGEYRLSVFPTAFGDKDMPLAPGVPPSQTRHGH